MLELRAAGHGDRELADALFRRCAALPEEGLGYPRCRDVADWDGELKLYGLTFEESTLLVTAGGRRCGVTGLLSEKGSGSAYVLGPMLVPQHRERLPEVLELLESDGRFGKLLVVASVSNEALHEALSARGWTLGPLELEMRRDRRPEDIAFPGTDVHEVVEGDEGHAPAVKLLKSVFRDWDGVHDGHQILSDAEGSAAAMWGMVRARVPFARIEYVAVSPHVRRRGLALALVGEVVFRAALAGAASIYVSLGPSNDAARALYARAGFVESAYMRTFSWESSGTTG